MRAWWLGLGLLNVARVNASSSFVRCSASRPMEDHPEASVYDGIESWFQYSSTGPTCSESDEWRSACGPAGRTSCQGEGNYGVWDANRMDCEAYSTLRETAKKDCGIVLGRSGFADCACGVFAVSDTAVCLVSTFTYRALIEVFPIWDNELKRMTEPAAFSYNGQTKFLTKGRIRGDFEKARDKSLELDIKEWGGGLGVVQFDAVRVDKADMEGTALEVPAPFVQRANPDGSARVWSAENLEDCSAVI